MIWPEPSGYRWAVATAAVVLDGHPRPPDVLRDDEPD
jgi:hypothetical protein